MPEVLAFLQENKIFYLATLDGSQPRLRPFGVAFIYDGKLCVCTSNTKEVFRQLKENSAVEISTTAANGTWLRLTGEAVAVTNAESKTAALNAAPSLKNLYSAQDNVFEVFAIINATATFFDARGGKLTATF